MMAAAERLAQDFTFVRVDMYDGVRGPLFGEMREANARTSRGAVGTIEVRLALHVLRPFVRDTSPLAAFWHAATALPRHPWASCHAPYRGVVERLAKLEVPVYPENEP